MSPTRPGKAPWIVLSLLLGLAVLSLAPQPAAPVSGGNAIALKAPSFLQVANAQEGTSAQDAPAAAPMGFPQDEAGISAYFKSASPVNLANVRGVFRVIEVETADYIIGSVPVPNYPESEDVHVFIHRNGWFVAYYLASDPVAKIYDWKSYSGTSIPTKLERIISIVASEAGVPLGLVFYYDFRYPNASHMMLIAETVSGGDDFTIQLPSTFAFYERSWGLMNIGFDDYWILNDVTIRSGSYCDYCTWQGYLTAAQLLPDRVHRIRVNDYGGLALIYRVP